MFHAILVPVVQDPLVNVQNLYMWAFTPGGPEGSILHWEALTPNKEHTGNHHVLPYGYVFPYITAAGVQNVEGEEWGFDLTAREGGALVTIGHFTVMYTVTMPDRASMQIGERYNLLSDVLFALRNETGGTLVLSDGTSDAVLHYPWAAGEELCIVCQSYDGQMRIGLVNK